MAIYILNFLSLLVYHFLIKDRKKFVILVSCQLFLILALRNPSVGMDLSNYAGGYGFISSLDFLDMLGRLRLVQAADLVYPFVYESGYVVLNWILGRLGVSFQCFLALHAAFCMGSFGVFIYRYSRAPWLSFAMLLSFSYFEYSFGILRQILALCILLYAVPLIEKRKPIPFFLLVFLAFTVHRVALIFAVLYFAYYITVTRLVYLINAAIWMLLIVFSPLIFNGFVAKILALIGKAGYGTSQFAWNHMTTLLFAVAAIAFVTLDFESMGERQNSIVCWGFLLTVTLQIFGMNQPVLARMVQMYLIFLVVFVPNIIADYQKKPVLREIGAYTLYAFTFFFMIYQFRSSPVVPYVPFF